MNRFSCHALRLSLLCSLLAVAAVAEAAPSPTLAGTVRCRGDRHFRMEADREKAVVWIGGQIIVLRRAATGNLTRYSSPAAALAIDGDFVVFIMNDALDFEECHLNRESLDGAGTIG